MNDNASWKICCPFFHLIYYSSLNIFSFRPIPGTGSLKVTIDATACSGSDRYVRYLEHVQVVITLTFTRRGDLTIKLISPRGTASVLLPQRREDYSSAGFTDWEFMSTHTWGEDPKGTWTLEIENHGEESSLWQKTFVYLNLHVSHKYSLCPLFFNKGRQKTRRKKFFLLKWCCMTLAIS